ncbi:hypothetical protein CCAX7_59550 [Capsulimonas corticalis]|uniref:Uncharacterized protein n=1 Tax=Capsulimonas corticalis TaxID=2219043 RepID=A0A402CZQ1_9BACT|nr:hypothetical protein [Capsulimonas corticalis]BDI33904.1 hypothetical protein CCAX7_59550 [Capsulimonas corticalis]
MQNYISADVVAREGHVGAGQSIRDAATASPFTAQLAALADVVTSDIWFASRGSAGRKNYQSVLLLDWRRMQVGNCAHERDLLVMRLDQVRWSNLSRQSDGLF